MMVDIQVPASPDVGDIHVESLHPRGLSNPDRVSGAASLLAHVGVPHGHLCLHDPVDLLVVHIPFVPGIGEGEVSVSLQGFAEHATHNTDHQVNSEMDMEKKYPLIPRLGCPIREFGSLFVFSPVQFFGDLLWREFHLEGGVRASRGAGPVDQVDGGPRDQERLFQLHGLREYVGVGLGG